MRPLAILYLCGGAMMLGKADEIIHTYALTRDLERFAWSMAAAAFLFAGAYLINRRKVRVEPEIADASEPETKST